MKKMQESKFKIYGCYSEQVNMLTDDEAGRLFKALLAYRNGEKPRNLTNVEMIVFSFIKQQLDHDMEVYEHICEKNRRNGAKGGRPKKNTEVKEASSAAGNVQAKEFDVSESCSAGNAMMTGELSGANMKCEVTARFV